MERSLHGVQRTHEQRSGLDATFIAESAVRAHGMSAAWLRDASIDAVTLQ
jgi:hypothetical protein